jgi:hypothetical protein
LKHSGRYFAAFSDDHDAIAFVEFAITDHFINICILDSIQMTFGFNNNRPQSTLSGFYSQYKIWVGGVAYRRVSASSLFDHLFGVYFYDRVRLNRAFSVSINIIATLANKFDERCCVFLKCVGSICLLLFLWLICHLRFHIYSVATI